MKTPNSTASKSKMKRIKKSFQPSFCRPSNNINFRRLFDNLDSALVSDQEDAGAQVSELLAAITELAQTSPFKDLKSPGLVVQEFLKSGKVIEL